MPTVGDILAMKGFFIHTVEASATVLEATRKMNQHKIGAVVVKDGERLAGIFTERDVLTRIVGSEQDPKVTYVAEVMTRDVICVPPTTDIDEASEIMRSRKIRHLPVCEEDRLMGVISIGDVNAHHATHQEQTIHFLNDYIYGRT
jgi:CBS domain-containing protein